MVKRKQEGQESKQRVYTEIQQFLGSYSEEWRLVYLLTLKVLLENKASLLALIQQNSSALFLAPEVQEFIEINVDQYLNAEGYLYTVVHNGLHMEALATAHMYTEDLGAFLICSKCAHHGYAQNFPDKFLDYNEQDVYKFYEEEVPSLSKNQCCLYLCFPTDKQLKRQLRVRGQVDEMKARIEESCKLFKDTLVEIRDFFLRTREFFQQYKHGCKVIIEPLGNVTKDNIDKVKENKVGLLFPLRRKKKSLFKGVKLSDREFAIIDLEEVNIADLVLIARKIYWLFRIIKSNLVSKYYTDEASYQILFLKPEGWETQQTSGMILTRN